MDEREISELVKQAVADVFATHLPTFRDQVTIHVMDALKPAIESAESKPTGGSPTDVLNAAVSSIYDAESQADILKALLEGGAQFTARAALFVVKGNTLNAWRSSGFTDQSKFKGLTLDASKGLAGRALQDREPVSAAATEFNSDFIRTHGNPSDGNANVLPLVVREKVAALLYADAGKQKAGRSDVSALRLLVRAASSWLEIMALRKTAGPAGAADAVGDISAPAPVAAAPPPPPPPPAAASAEPSLEGLSKEDQDLHKKAKRFARLLVDEIKLYNPAKVAEGKQKKDLYERLKEDIDKSRATYEKRYGATSAGKAGYFNAEVVRILGENDASVLGAGFQE
jgi:hypothetical protein